MVIYALMKTFFGLVNGITALMPQGPAPDFMSNIAPQLHSVFLGAAGLGAWIPWALALSILGVIFSTWLVLTGISAIRYLLGWIPTMGGA